MNASDSPRYRRSPDLVWRLAPDRVIVRKVTDESGGAVDLAGPAALIWVAAEESISVAELVADTGTQTAVTERTIAMLVDGGWLTQTRASGPGHETGS